MIDNFQFGFRDWYTINGSHRSLWQHWTRKVTDPNWCGPKGTKLALTIQSEQPNVLGIVLHVNTWRHYRGKKRTYMAEVKLKGGGAETVTVGLAEFKKYNRRQAVEKLGGVGSTWPRGQGHDSRSQTGRSDRRSLAGVAAGIQATGVGDGKRLRKHGGKAGEELKAKGN